MEVLLGREIERSRSDHRLAVPDGPFEVTHRRVDRARVLDVRGELDVAHAPALGVAVHEALGGNPSRLVIGLSRVPLVDARGLSVLLSARRRALHAGVELRLACDVKSTLRLLAVSRLDSDFDVRPSTEAALWPPASADA